MTEAVLDVWLVPVPDHLPDRPLYPPERQRQVEGTKKESLRLARAAAWQALEAAAENAFGCSFRDLRFCPSPNGGWRCDSMFFSLTHAGGMAAAAVSDRPVGLDLEEAARLEGPPERTAALRRMIALPDGSEDGVPLPALWTIKESIFKTLDRPFFRPASLAAAGHRTLTMTVPEAPGMVLSVCSGQTDRLRVFFRSEKEDPAQLSPHFF